MNDAVDDIVAGLKTGRFGNEDAVKQGIVLRLLGELGWPIFDPNVVWPQFPIDGQRADYALCHPPRRPVALIEVKAVGQYTTGQDQLFEYAFRQGAPLAILTDGARWEFYLPAASGTFNDRRVYTLDLVERTPVEIVERLHRYLAYPAVCSGEAVDAARHDHEGETQRRLVLTTMPTAWCRLVNEADELLIDLVADKVAELCGYRPEPGIVLAFLTKNLHLATSQPSIAPATQQSSANHSVNSSHAVQPEGKPEIPRRLQVGFYLDGREHRARDGVDLLIRAFQELARRDATFLERFAALPEHGRKRRYISRQREELFPDRQDLVASYARDLVPGWYIGVNLSKASIERVLKLACEVSGLSYGVDLRVFLGEAGS